MLCDLALKSIIIIIFTLPPSLLSFSPPLLPLPSSLPRSSHFFLFSSIFVHLSLFFSYYVFPLKSFLVSHLHVFSFLLFFFLSFPLSLIPLVSCFLRSSFSDFYFSLSSLTFFLSLRLQNFTSTSFPSFPSSSPSLSPLLIPFSLLSYFPLSYFISTFFLSICLQCFTFPSFPSFFSSSLSLILLISLFSLIFSSLSLFFNPFPFNASSVYLLYVFSLRPLFLSLPLLFFSFLALFSLTFFSLSRALSFLPFSS